MYTLFDSNETVLEAFDSKIFRIKFESTGFSDKVSDHSNLKILTPKQMLQRLPIASKIISKIKESCKHLFLINKLANYLIFHQRMLYSENLVTQSFHIFRYGLLITFPNH